MAMEGGMKNKRAREEESQDPCNQKHARLNEVGIHDFDDSLTAFSSEYAMLLKDPWTLEDGPVSEVRGIAIRKQSYMEDYFNNNYSIEEVGLEEKMKKQDDGVVDLFEELWRPQSPLGGAAEALFGGSDYFMGTTTNLVDDRTSGFRIWEQQEQKQDQEQEDEKCFKSADGIGLLYENEVSDWIWGAPMNQPLLPESLEFEVSTPSL